MQQATTIRMLWFAQFHANPAIFMTVRVQFKTVAN